MARTLDDRLESATLQKLICAMLEALLFDALSKLAMHCETKLGEPEQRETRRSILDALLGMQRKR